MEKELKRVGLYADRVPGKMPVEEEFDLTNPKYKVMLDRTPGALGCHYSQISIMKEALHLGKSALVMEDDIIFCSDIKKRLDHIEFFLNEQTSWDIVFLGATFNVNPPAWHTGNNPDLPDTTWRKDAECTNDPNIMRVYGIWSTYAYIVNIKSIEKVLKLLEDNVHLSMGIDWLFIMLGPQLKNFCFVPGCVKQMDNQSDIGTGITKFSDFEKLGPYWWADKAEEFDPTTFNWGEAALK